MGGISECMCCSLETGCLIIAIMELILEVILFLIGCIEAEAASVIGGLLGIVAAGLLLWGTLQKKPTPVLAYLTIEGLSTIGYIMLFVVMQTVGAYRWRHGELCLPLVCAPIVVFIVVAAIALGILLYLWIVVYSFYRQLKEGGSPSAPPIYKA